MLNTSLYWIFLVISITTIMSPGPGVLMSMTNSIHYGLSRAMPGIVGCAVGTLGVAAVSVTSLGILIAKSPMIYAAIKFLGILYLYYLGWKKFRDKPFAFSVLNAEIETVTEEEVAERKRTSWRIFVEGIILQLSNPALIIFYLSLFPQCVDPSLPYTPQVVVLSFNYCVMVWIIHSCYGWIAATASHKFFRPEASVWINRVSGAAYWLLATAFAVPILMGTV